MVCFLTTGVLAIAGILTRTYSLRSIRAIMGEEEVVRTLRNVAIDGGPSNRNVNGAGVVQLCPMEVRASATGGVDSSSISISICMVGGSRRMTSKPRDDPATAIAMTRRIFDPSPEAANILRRQRFGRRQPQPFSSVAALPSAFSTRTTLLLARTGAIVLDPSDERIIANV